MAVRPPNFTQIPNEILDRMHEMTMAEYRVLTAICRQTFGWHKSEEVISLSQLERMTGLSRTAVQAGIMAGMGRGMLERRPVGPQAFSYHLLVVSDYQSTETTSGGGGPQPVVSAYQPVVSDYQSTQPTSSLSSPEPVASVDQQLVGSDYSVKERVKEKRNNHHAPVLTLIPGGGAGDDNYERDDVRMDELDTDDGLIDACEIEPQQTRRAELVDQLVALGVWRSKALQAVDAGTVASEHDVVCCKRFLAASSAERPGGVLWNEWLSTGKVPPIPGSDRSTVTAAQLAEARRLLEESDQRNAHAEHLSVPFAARQVMDGGRLRRIPPGGKPASFWRTSP